VKIMTGKMLTTKYGPDFIERTLKTTGVILVIIFAFVSVYWGLYPALAILSGGIWSMINMIFLSALVRTAFRPEKVDKLAVIGLAFIKFPLLYATLYFLFSIKIFPPIPMIIGVSMVLAVMVLKAAARAMYKLDQVDHPESTQGQA